MKFPNSLNQHFEKTFLSNLDKPKNYSILDKLNINYESTTEKKEKRTYDRGVERLGA